MADLAPAKGVQGGQTKAGALGFRDGKRDPEERVGKGVQ